MALVSLRSRSHFKESMVLSRTDHLFMHNYIRSFLNNILRSTLINGPDKAQTRVLLLVCLTQAVGHEFTEQHRQYIYIYIYI